MSWAELTEKFRECAALVLARNNAEAAIELVERIEKLRNLTPLLQVLTGRRKARRKIERRPARRSGPWKPIRKS
jgi:hypothetical protein